ncbi:hypothetical protein KM043_007063 [Ampulex compressa]|nr:hypothetical protein KM043_007063 [Ampulex compressa]
MLDVVVLEDGARIESRAEKRVRREDVCTEVLNASRFLGELHVENYASMALSGRRTKRRVSLENVKPLGKQDMRELKEEYFVGTIDRPGLCKCHPEVGVKSMINMCF